MLLAFAMMAAIGLYRTLQLRFVVAAKLETIHLSTFGLDEHNSVIGLHELRNFDDLECHV